jgi:hypothetical protein
MWLLPHVGSEVLGIGSDLLQSLGRGAKQEAIDNPLVLQGERAKRHRESEHNMKIFNREQLGFAGVYPLRSRGGATLGTVTVAARVVGYIRGRVPRSNRALSRRLDAALGIQERRGACLSQVPSWRTAAGTSSAGAKVEMIFRSGIRQGCLYCSTAPRPSANLRR